MSSTPTYRISVLFAALMMAGLFACKTKQSATSSENTKGQQLEGKARVDFERMFFDGNKEKMLHNYDLAETYFNQALRINPNSAATMYELANIYDFQDNHNQALLYSKKAAALEPKNIWYQLLYADCLKASKMGPELITQFEKIVKDFPDHIEPYYDLAEAYIYNNKLNEAIKVYNKIEDRIGVTEGPSMRKMKIYQSMKNYDKSIEEAQKLIKAYPKDAKYYGMLGEIYQELGQNDKAFAAYNELLKIDPDNAYVHLSLADYYRNLKQNDKAFEEIKTAFKSKDLDIDTKVKILLSYYSITETYTELRGDADELCKIVVAVHPNEAKAYSIYGDFLSRDKKIEEARTQYRKAVALDKERYAIWNALLLIESDLNDFAAMEKESKETMELFPNQPFPYFINGIANIQFKRFKEAIAALTEGKEFVYDNKLLLAQFYANIGDAQNQLKNYAASDSAYDKALEIDPSNVYVLNNFAYYLSLRNEKLEQAERMSKKSNDLEPNNNSYQDTYGWILYQMKKYEDAKLWVGKALDNGGRGSGTLLEHYGDILFMLGDKDGALKYWTDAKKAGSASELIDKKIADKKLYE